MLLGGLRRSEWLHGEHQLFREQARRAADGTIHKFSILLR